MRCHYLVLDPKVVECHDILWRAALKSVEILHGEVVVLIPSQFQTWGIVCNPLHSRLVKEVVYFLFVDLQVAAIHSELLLL